MAARCEHRQALEFTRTSPLLVWLTQGEIGLYGGDKRAAPFPTLKPALRIPLSATIISYRIASVRSNHRDDEV
jgi:hypothetical protein